MTGLNKQEPLILFLGDVVIFAITLWLALFLRYGSVPPIDRIQSHFLAFLPLVAIWLVVFFIAGLYERHTLILRSRLPNIVIGAQIANGIVAVAFFYFATYLTIAPKTVLFIYVALAAVAAILWRLYGYPIIGSRSKQRAFLIGQGEEIRELETEVNQNDFYAMKFVSSIDVDKIAGLDIRKDLIEEVYADEVSIIALDTRNPKINPLLPHLYNLVFSNVKFISLHRLYEEIFKRVPLSLVGYEWFLENVSNRSKPVYDALKRIIDVAISLPLLVVPLLSFPFVYIAVKIEDGGPVFIFQTRVGENNRLVKFVKFRTMLFSEDGEWQGRGKENKVTRVGAFLRKTRLDEFPQLWNVLIGDASLVGPRPEFPEPVRRYSEELPYYNVRHMIKPGLSGWAQIYGEHPHHGVDVTKTANKLAYDLYYINNRSLLLDLEIALKTVRILLTFKGK